MAALFLLLAVLIGVVLVDAVLENTTASTVTLFDRSFSQLSAGELLVVFAGLGFLLALFLFLAFGSSRSRRTRRRELRSARRDAESRVEDLEHENARLRDELARAGRVGRLDERNATTAAPVGTRRRSATRGPDRHSRPTGAPSGSTTAPCRRRPVPPSGKPSARDPRLSQSGPRTRDRATSGFPGSPVPGPSRRSGPAGSRSGSAGTPSTALARAVTDTDRPVGASGTWRRTATTARTAEQSQEASSAPLAAAIPAAPTEPPPGVSAASAAMSAAVCAAALAAASAATSTASVPASVTNATRPNATRVAPPSCDRRRVSGRPACREVPPST